MKIEYEQRGKYLLIRVMGRLDAAWAEYFTEELFLHIRRGQHHIIIDASGMVFLSSAGIRSLLRVFKEINTVKGSFLIVNATDFVEETLITTRFEMWLGDEFPADMPAFSSGNEIENSGIEHFIFNENATLILNGQAGWQPWQAIDHSQVKRVDFSQDTVALGIGSSAETLNEARDQYGEFLAVAGNVVYQLPDEQGHPDYLITEKQYVPRMQCIQLLSYSGEMGYHNRFAPTDKTLFYPLSAILKNMLDHVKGKAIGFVMLGEIEGLVGSFLSRSPGLLEESQKISFPEIRDWLSFSGERSYRHQQALIVGFTGNTEDLPGQKKLSVLPSCPEFLAHIHGAVFPYQPLQNGKIELKTAVQKFFNGPPPLAVMHLVDDARPVVGLGESALIRGACWFSPLQNPEVLS
ncbi:MAG: STAS domain-containing protein [Candidatus Marinimicrobia bacterium]|nr:STAS domain-containing protein [Candidatus Neomarinimicrobiota bacterium]